LKILVSVVRFRPWAPFNILINKVNYRDVCIPYNVVLTWGNAGITIRSWLRLVVSLVNYL
jgi:hypothetical protein